METVLCHGCAIRVGFQPQGAVAQLHVFTLTIIFILTVNKVGRQSGAKITPKSVLSGDYFQQTAITGGKRFRATGMDWATACGWHVIVYGD